MEPYDVAFMRDTDLETQRKYYAMLKRLTPDQRVAETLRLSQMVREQAMAAIRRTKPHLSSDEVRQQYLKLILRPDEYQSFYPAESARA